MKKKVVSISLICVFALSALMCIILPIVYFITGNFMQNLSEYMVDLDGATAFGISSDSSTARASSVNAIPNAKSNAISDKKHHKNYMVVQKNGSDEVHKVDFKKRHDKDQKNDHDSNISQDDMSAEIDKLYVLGDYTFISFVREGESKRPNDNKLEFDADGIAFYDKKDYYTDNDRKSYIIDNTTGYIYAIVDFSISEIQGGLLISAEDNRIYDFKINADDKLEIFSLFTNDSIEWSSCFKDKHGNKFINNNQINTYDESTNTFWGKDYYLTSNNECIKISYSHRVLNEPKYDCLIYTSNGNWRNLTVEDTFDIYTQGDYHRVNEGCVYYNNNRYREDSGGNPKKFLYNLSFFIYDAVNNEIVHGTDDAINLYRSNDFVNGYYRTDYMGDYGIIICYNYNNVYYYKNVWDSIDNILPNSKIMLKENVVLNEDSTGVLVYGINGNINYDFGIVENNGEYEVQLFEYGTYTPPVRILLQPINK